MSLCCSCGAVKYSQCRANCGDSQEHSLAPPSLTAVLTLPHLFMSVAVGPWFGYSSKQLEDELPFLNQLVVISQSQHSKRSYFYTHL